MEIGLQPSFVDLTEFLEKRALVAHTKFGKLVGSKQGEPRGKRPPWRASDAKGTVLPLSKVGGEVVNQDLRNTKSVKGKYPVDSRAICKFCNRTHELERCFKFRNKCYAQRKDFVRKQNLCENCLKPSHIARHCRSPGACLLSGCGERHHSLLHPPSSSGAPMGIGESGRTQTTSDQVNTNSSEANEETATASPHHIEAGGDRTANSNETRISLRIVPIRVSAKNRREVETYAFLDDGSDTTLCLQRLVEELDVEGSPTSFALTTINAEGTQPLVEEVSLTVKALMSNEYIHLDRVWTVDKLSVSKSSIPCTEDIRDWPHLQGISLPKLDKEVSTLISSDIPEAHWVFEGHHGRSKQPCAARTLLGWTLIGTWYQPSCSKRQFPKWRTRAFVGED